MTAMYLYIDSPSIYQNTINSFFLFIFDHNLKELKHYQLPISVVAPFANRLFKEIPEVMNVEVREPWYNLLPQKESEYTRSPLPKGPTSLYAKSFDPETQPPPHIQMHPTEGIRHFVVQLFDFQTRLYKGIYDVNDIFLHGASYLLHEGHKKDQVSMNDNPYYYAIFPSQETVRSAPPEAFPIDAYDVEGVFRLPPQAKDDKRIIFKPIPEPPLPKRHLDSFGTVTQAGKGEPQAGQIIIPKDRYDELEYGLKLSETIEQGGYLLGNIWRMPDSPESEKDPNFKWIVEVTDLLMAEDTIGSPATLLFTGDSWSKISRQIDQNYANRKLVGWFHTHVFPATDNFGLSGLDLDMHNWYLPRCWHIAVLLNLEKNNRRTVRCYQRGKESFLMETPFLISESHSEEV
jgi:hypothetical protein